MKEKLTAKGKMLKVALGKLKYHMSQNAMEHSFSVRYVGFSKGTINSICKIIDSNNLDIETIRCMDEEECDKLLRPKQSEPHNKKELPNFSIVHKKLVSDKRMTLFFLWRMYYKDNDDPYSYGRYCELYREWCHKNKKAPVMVMNEPPGENMYVDWMGDTLDYCFDGSNIDTVHFFCTTLGMSQFPYIEGFLDEKLPSYITGHIHAFTYYGGIPKYVVPDNTKCATIKNTKDDLVLNRVYEDMQEHYGYVVMPARPKKPTDKNDVEFTVGWFERQLIMEIKDKQYSSLEELNGDVLRICKELSNLPFQVKSGTRAEWFNEYDKIELKPLPLTHFEVYDYCSAKVPDSYHVTIKSDKLHYYSVPYRLLGHTVIIKYSFNKVIITDTDGNNVATHNRCYTRYTYYTTNPEHMPANHRIANIVKTKDSSWYLGIAGTVGFHVRKVIQAILDSKKHPEQGYRACMGILALHFSHTYTDAQIERVCKEACELNNMTYSYVTRRLKSLKEKETLNHENIRGESEYQ